VDTEYYIMDDSISVVELCVSVYISTCYLLS